MCSVLLAASAALVLTKHSLQDCGSERLAACVHYITQSSACCGWEQRKELDLQAQRNSAKRSEVSRVSTAARAI